uniref:IS30 family transposase n=1 Tax=Caldanaerobius fijiensis TaxID=456330 RepID=UPI00116062C3
MENREEFGHWEIDTVLGRRSNGHILLTLTERKTRYHLLLPLVSKTTEAVDEALKQLKSQYGLMFSRVFRSITADNGSEFANSNVHGIDIYYTHPYSAWK